jgi:hypothetical protein
MVGIGLLGETHTEIIDDQTEDDIAQRVIPQSRRERSGVVVAMGRQELDKLIVGQAPGLREAVHAALNFDEQGMPVLHRGQQVVLLDDDRCGKHEEGDPHVNVPFHRSTEVKVLEIGGHEFGVGVERTLFLKSSLAVVRSAVFVLTSNG